MPSDPDPAAPGIPAPVVLEMVRNLLQFPYPQICRHLVAAELLGALEEAGCRLPDGLIAAAFESRDGEALELLGQAATPPSGHTSA